MTTKQFLREVRKADRHINTLIAEKERLREIAEGVSGMTYDEVRVQTSRTLSGNRQTDAVYRLIEIEIQTDDEINSYMDMREEAVRIISMLPNRTEQDILKCYYMSGMTWEKVAEYMNYELRYIFKLHGKALRYLDHLQKGHKKTL